MLRTVVLLLLCLSTGICATLGHYQTQAKEEEEVPAVDSADEPAANSLFGDNLLAKILAADSPAADKPEVDVPVADGVTAEEQPSSVEEEGNDIRPVQTNQSLNRPLAHEDDNSWSLNSIRNSFQTVHGYFDSMVELVGGHNGVCQYRCRYGEPPQPRPGYQLPEPNGCSSSLVGFQLDLGIPAMTKCCNQLDVCYDTCGRSKYDCDSKFRSCLHGICSDLNKSLGFVSKVQACESVADTLYNTVWTLGCRPYMNSQRAACVCEGEERDEL
ncbi:group XIIB secretory phospholipase A2-like protein isoform X2 [Siniperca chuatsi]|uniref:group XIIB secretory phospholipase A2-like protein isoform X2 n=1 Tax=Siniperca chuatsi TaxID=119488 RepID=UPI001CE0A101|nr:group XIIB secretory phospholipase A2-like protein isoform X2 [Siniperca chuatsi]